MVWHILGDWILPVVPTEVSRMILAFCNLQVRLFHVSSVRSPASNSSSVGYPTLSSGKQDSVSKVSFAGFYAGFLQGC
jgi:hypothetical protein